HPSELRAVPFSRPPVVWVPAVYTTFMTCGMFFSYTKLAIGARLPPPILQPHGFVLASYRSALRARCSPPSCSSSSPSLKIGSDFDLLEAAAKPAERARNVLHQVRFEVARTEPCATTSYRASPFGSFLHRY